MGWAVGGWAAAAALFHVWTAYAGVWEPRQMRATHLLFLLPLAFLLFPASARSPGDRVSRWDWAWVVGSVLPCLYVLQNVHELTERWEGVHPVSHAQVLVGTVLVIAVLEAARRAVGFWFFVTTLAFMEGQGLSRGVIPKGSYKDVVNNDVDIPTITMANTIVANAKVSEQDVYAFTTILLKNLDDVRRVHPAFKAFDPKDAVKLANVPLHPGAAKAYRDARLLN